MDTSARLYEYFRLFRQLAWQKWNDTLILIVPPEASSLFKGWLPRQNVGLVSFHILRGHQQISIPYNGYYLITGHPAKIDGATGTAGSIYPVKSGIIVSTGDNPDVSPYGYEHLGILLEIIGESASLPLTSTPLRAIERTATTLLSEKDLDEVYQPISIVATGYDVLPGRIPTHVPTPRSYRQSRCEPVQISPPAE